MAAGASFNYLGGAMSSVTGGITVAGMLELDGPGKSALGVLHAAQILPPGVGVRTERLATPSCPPRGTGLPAHRQVHYRARSETTTQMQLVCELQNQRATLRSRADGVLVFIPGCWS